MSLNKYASLHIFDINFSIIFFSYRVVMHMLALIALLMPLSLPGWLVVTLIVLVSASAFYHVVWRSIFHNRPKKLYCHPTGNFTLVFERKTFEDLHLDTGKVYYSAWLIILPFKGENKKYTLTLWRDSLGYEKWRLLQSLIHQIADSDVSETTRFATKL